MSELDDQEMQAKILKYGSIQETQPNRPGLMLARALRGTRDFINDSPLFGSSDLGNLVFGHSPEAIEDYAYGGKPYTGSGWTTKADPRLVDIAALPMVGGGLAKLARSATTPKSEMARALVGEQSVVDNEARRNFLKQGAALAGASAAGAAVPDVVRALMKEVAPAVAVQGGKAGLSAAAVALGGAGKFFKTNFEKLVDYWNIGSGLPEAEQGVWRDSLDDFIAHPKSKELLEKALEGVDPKKLDPDFLPRLLTWEANPSLKKIPGANEFPSDAYYRQSPPRPSDLENPKNLADYEHFLLTGELRKGAHPDLPHESTANLPDNSRFKPLVDLGMDISGRRSEKLQAAEQAMHDAWRASPEGKYHKAFMDSPEYKRYGPDNWDLTGLENEFKKRYRPE